MKPRFQTKDATLYHGDATEILPQLDPVDLIVTSPPYDNRREYGGTEFNFEKMADAIVPVLADGGVLVWVVNDATINNEETGTSFRQALDFKERGLKLHDTMIYMKSGVPFPTPKRYSQVFEYMFVMSKGIPKTANIIKDHPNKESSGVRNRSEQENRNVNGKMEIKWKKDHIVHHQPYSNRYNIWEYHTGSWVVSNNFREAHDHPAIFPYALARDHIISWSNPGDTVLDPMAGSGTTLRAAVDNGRKAIGIEIHEPYCEIIEKRLAQQVMEMT